MAGTTQIRNFEMVTNKFSDLNRGVRTLNVDAMWFCFRTLLKMKGLAIFILSMHCQLISEQNLTKIVNKLPGQNSPQIS